MLDKLKARISNPFTKGANPRGLKQFFVGADSKPELEPEVQAVLSYLTSIADKPVTNRRIARETATPNEKVGNIISQLVTDGLVEKQYVTKQSSRYQIIGGGPNTSKVTQTTEPNGSETDEVDFVKTSEELIFKFVRATRSTDLLLYLTWLERGGK